jgi:hypothetical protein
MRAHEISSTYIGRLRTAHPGTAVVAPQAGFSVPKLGREPFPHRGANVGTLRMSIRYSKRAWRTVLGGLPHSRENGRDST